MLMTPLWLRDSEGGGYGFVALLLLFISSAQGAASTHLESRLLVTAMTLLFFFLPQPLHGHH